MIDELMEIRDKMVKLIDHPEADTAHYEADQLLIELIRLLASMIDDDVMTFKASKMAEEIVTAYEQVSKWYS